MTTDIDRLRIVGLRKSVARLSLLSEFKKAHKPQTAPQLVKKLSQFDRATIYRELNQLCRAGFIKQTHLGGKRASSYFLRQTGHSHLAVCLCCGQAENVRFNSGDCRKRAVEQKTGFRVVDHKAEYFGYCATCA